MNWYDDTFRKMHFDMHTPGDVQGVAAGFDARKLARQLERIGVEAICWFAKCAYGWSYYPTVAGRRHPFLAQDMFPLAVEACHERGIKVLAYYHLTGCQWAMADHPEWHSLNAEGKVAEWSEIAVNYGLCALGPAGDALIIPQLIELVTMQPADGIFIDDLVGWSTCYCDACREAFGGDMPRGPEEAGWDEYLAWRREASAAFFERAFVEVHKHRPDALIGVNWAGSFRHPDLIPEGTGYLTADVDETESSSFNASLLLRQWARQPLPHDAMNSRMLHWWRDWTQKPVAAMKQEFATILANGGRTFLGDISYHGTAMPDPQVLTNAGEAFAFAREIEPYVRGTSPVADIAILNSAQSHYLGKRNPNCDPAGGKGAHLSLMEGGRYAHVLTEADLPALLADYRCLVIPEQPWLSAGSVATIRDYVAGGGGLVVTGETPLEDVLGVDQLGAFEGDRNYFVCDEGDLNPDDEAVCPPRLVHGKSAMTATTTASVLADHIASLPGAPPHSGAPPSPDRSGFPAITLNRSGEGTAAFVALPIATDLWSRGHAALSPILPGLVRRVCEPLLELESEAPLEITALRGGDKLFIHLVNYSASRNPGRPPTVSRLTRAMDVYIRVRLDKEPLWVEGVPAVAQWWMEEGTLVVLMQRVETWVCVEVGVGDQPVE